MPVSLSSRYYGIPVYEAIEADGSTHATVAIRPFTPPAPDATAYHHVVSGAETIDYLAWRYYGSSAAWWRIAEANEFVFPLDIRPGTALTLPSPGEVGRVERTRRF